MRLFGKRKNTLSRQEIITQWLELYPRRQLKYIESDDQHIVLLVPHSQNWFTRKFLPAPKNPAQRIHLDLIGSFIWSHFDGTHTLKAIAQKAQEKFAENVHPVHERLVLFAQQMYKQKFITLYRQPYNEALDSRDKL